MIISERSRTVANKLLAEALSAELVYFGARTLSEVVAGHLLVISLYVLEPGYRVTSRRRLFAGGDLLGLVFLLRIQLAPALVVVALWTNWRAVGERGPAMLAGAVAVLAAAGILDILTLGYPLASVWRNFLYNVYYGASSTFGVESWPYYLLGELGVWGGGAATLVLLAGLGARRMPLPLAAAVTILAVHSAIAQQRVPLHLPGDHAGHGYGRHRTGASGSLGTRLVAGSARAPKDGYRRLGRPRPELVVPGLVPCVDGGRSDGPRLSTGQR